MVKPSNPKLMARVLEAVTYLSDGKGSLTRDILKFVKNSSTSASRNLTMQVRRALKNAVTAGLLGCRSGRYKMQLDLSNVSHRREHEDSDDYKNTEAVNDMRDELQIDDINLSRKIQGRQKSSRKKRPAQKARKRSRTRVLARKATRRRAATMEKRGRKGSKRPRGRTVNKNDRAEDWATRKRRMMSKPKFDIDDDDDEEEEEEEEEQEDVRETRRLPKMKSVNEDRYSNASGDSSAVGRHRSRRSKHLARERRSPSRKGNGDTESQRKSSRRSTSRRRRSKPRQRESRDPAPEEAVEDHGRTMNDEQETEVMEMDEDQGDRERSRTPPDNQGNE